MKTKDIFTTMQNLVPGFGILDFSLLSGFYWDLLKRTTRLVALVAVCICLFDLDLLTGVVYSAWFFNFDFLFLFLFSFVDQALLTGALVVQHCEHCGGLLNAALLFLGLLPGPCSARAMAIPTVNSSPWKVGWPNMKTAYSGPQSLGRLTNIKTKVEILDIWKYLKSMQSGPRTHRPTRPRNSVATDLNTQRPTDPLTLD